MLNGAEIPGSRLADMLSSTSIELKPLMRGFIANVNAAEVLALQPTGSSTANHVVRGGTGSVRASTSLTITRIR